MRDSTLMLVRGVRPSPSLISVSARLTRLVGPVAAAAAASGTFGKAW